MQGSAAVLVHPLLRAGGAVGGHELPRKQKQCYSVSSLTKGRGSNELSVSARAPGAARAGNPTSTEALYALERHTNRRNEGGRVEEPLPVGEASLRRLAEDDDSEAEHLLGLGLVQYIVGPSVGALGLLRDVVEVVAPWSRTEIQLQEDGHKRSASGCLIPAAARLPLSPRSIDL